jgi:hypothetical protein
MTQINSTIHSGASLATIGGRVVRIETQTAISTMLIGSDRSPIDMVTYPQQTYTRIYNQLGKGLKIPTGVPAWMTPHVSFRDQPTAALLSPLIAWAHARTVPTIIEWEHEQGQGSLTSTAYGDGVDDLIDLVAAEPLLAVAQTFTAYAARRAGQPGAKTMADGVPLTVPNLLRPGTAYLGFDCEKDAGFGTACPDPEAFFAVCLQQSAAAGVPWIVPELGWVDPGDGSLPGWYTSVASYLRLNGCAGVAAYDTLGTTGDYRLAGAAQAAWQSAVAGA